MGPHQITFIEPSHPPRTMPNRQRPYSDALDQEAAKLCTIAERLGGSIERFEAFMASHDATAQATSVEDASPRGDTINDSQQLARKLREERKLLIAAWEQLERENRHLLTKPELVASPKSTPPQPRATTNTDSTVLPPLIPFQTVSETSVSKRVQFQYLQREIDRRG